MDKATYLNSLKKKKKKTDSSAKPQTVNRTGKSDVIKPQTVNRTGKSDVIKPQTVNRTGKSDVIKPQTVNRVDKATYLNFLKKKKKVGVEEGLTSAYEYGKAKIKQAYEAASRPTGTSALIPTKAKTAKSEGPGRMGSQTITTAKTRSSVGGPGAARALEDRPSVSATAATAGPGRMGSQTVTAPKRIGVNATPPGGPPSGTRPSVAAAAATAASAVNNKGAAPKGTTPTKRYKNARERRMAERYAIGTSGRPM
jgi:hypothetical protein